MTYYVAFMVGGFIISVICRAINLWTGGWAMRVRWAYIADTVVYAILAIWGLVLLLS